MKQIPLTQGKVAFVDDGDYEWLNQWKWYAHEDKKNGKFYAYRNSKTVNGKRKSVFMHKEILMPGHGMKVDHKNGTGTDNQRENLRECSSSQNGANIKTRKNNKSGYKGVCWKPSHKKWASQIKTQGRVFSLGYYDFPEDAARAYDQAATKYHGRFATLNFGG